MTITVLSQRQVTEREKVIVQLIANGATYHKVSLKMERPLKTIQRWVSEIRYKYNEESNVGLVRLFHFHGLIK